MGRISTHVLDSSLGAPGAGVDVTLEFHTSDGWLLRGSGTTDGHGRIDSFIAEDEAESGNYRLTFDTGSYFHLRDQDSFYPEVVVLFEVTRPEEHHHIPLLLSPFGYTTYRGS